jgi:hydrogenase maturation protease
MKSFPNHEKGGMWIIGFGNRHRRDDGIGPYVVEELKKRFDDAAGINMASLHQLAPELAEDICNATGVVFVDAARGPVKGGFSISRLKPLPETREFVHSFTPAGLLELALAVYNRCPPAWMVAVEGNDFGFGEGLSAKASGNAKRAVGEIARIISAGD